MGLPPETYRPEPSPVAEPSAPVTDWSDYEEPEFTVWDPATYDPVWTDRRMTMDDWYSESLLPADYLRWKYPEFADLERPNIEIMRQLEAEDYYRDFDQWRADYEAMVHG